MCRRALCFLAIPIVLGWSGTVHADEAAMMGLLKNLQAQVTQMQETIIRQDEKIRQIEARLPAISVAPAAGTEAAGPAAVMTEKEFAERLEGATGGASKWLKDLKFSGDYRLRYDAFHYTSGSPAETDDRNRFRMRLRFGFEKKFGDDMKVGFALASGEGGAAGSNGLNTDPTSTNTTFDNNFNFKAIWIDKAWASYAPSFLKDLGILEKAEITAGKMANPFEKGSSDMVWDRDVRPEGIAEKLQFKLLKTDALDLKGHATFGQYVLDEDITAGGDANLFAYQVGLNPVFDAPFLEKPADLLQAFSFYDYSNYARKNNFLIGASSLARGNPNADNLTTELDAGKFRVMESYTELTVRPFDLPTRFHFDLAGNISNQAASNPLTGSTVKHSPDTDVAYGLGVKLGSAAKKGEWEAGYEYKHIGANAVAGGFADADFGDGYAGKRGSVIRMGYGLTDNLTLNSALYFVNNLNTGTAGILDQEQRKFQVDLSWKF